MADRMTAEEIERWLRRAAERSIALVGCARSGWCDTDWFSALAIELAEQVKGEQSNAEGYRLAAEAQDKVFRETCTENAQLTPDEANEEKRHCDKCRCRPGCFCCTNGECRCEANSKEEDPDYGF